MTIEDTIEEIISQKLSVVRFGDGEMAIINGYSIAFQYFDEKLKDQLISVAESKLDKLLICIPDIFYNLKPQNHRAQIFWKCHLLKYRKCWLKYFRSPLIYGNAFISRFYIDWIDKNHAKARFYNIKKIWQNRDIVLIEGGGARMGVGNDLFSGCKSIKRIVCPSKNAFEKFDLILESATSIDRKCLILIALGPCAKPLVLNLHGFGFQAIDVGHIDIEYEWFLSAATNKIAINGKMVNEVEPDGFIDECLDAEYLRQIITVIK
jgi:glycosyltransferase family protein